MQKHQAVHTAGGQRWEFYFSPVKHVIPISIRISISSPKLLLFSRETHGNPMVMGIPIPMHTSTIRRHWRYSARLWNAFIARRQHADLYSSVWWLTFCSSTALIWRNGSALVSINEVDGPGCFCGPVSTGMGDRVEVQLPVWGIYFGM